MQTKLITFCKVTGHDVISEGNCEPKIVIIENDQAIDENKIETRTTVNGAKSLYLLTKKHRVRRSGFDHKNTVCGGMYILLERIRITKGSQMDTCQRPLAQSIRIALEKIAPHSFSPYKLDVTKVIAF